MFEKTPARVKNKRRTNAVQRFNRDIGVIDLTDRCPGCGAMVTIDPNHINTHCPFCNASLPKAHELLKMSYDYMNKRSERDMEIRRMKHEERIESQKNFGYKFRLVAIITVGVMCVVGIICMLLITHRR